MSGFPQLHPRTRIVNDLRRRVHAAIAEAPSDVTYAEILFVLADVSHSYAADAFKEERSSQCSPDTLRTPPELKRRPKYEYRADSPDNFRYSEWIDSIGSDGWLLCAIDTDGTHVFARDAGRVPPQAEKD